jgi:hypothetical protein
MDSGISLNNAGSCSFMMATVFSRAYRRTRASKEKRKTVEINVITRTPAELRTSL